MNYASLFVKTEINKFKTSLTFVKIKKKYFDLEFDFAACLFLSLRFKDGPSSRVSTFMRR